MYAVVTLEDSDEVMVSASDWLSSDKTRCYWPPFRSQEKCTEAVKNRHAPDGKWEMLKIIFHGEFDKDDILQMLREIKSKVDENSTMLKRLVNDTLVSDAAPSSTSTQSKDMKSNLDLPLRSIEDVQRLERELKVATTRKKYVNYLSGLAAFGLKDVIKSMMQHVLTNDLVKEFNWTGKGDKKPFSNLVLADVIKDAAFKHKISRGDCEAAIKKYLSNTAIRPSQKRQRDEVDLLPSASSGTEFSNMISQPYLEDASHPHSHDLDLYML
ncbi:uncharacterized protein LOC130415192 [Triplophysa dalaica]|uniref:uncharacterized protein LOC130415192 n=1 Tax=Triplophysa dalaica TaxID=1582913 RepID=UPI0024DF8308|nr:uncharacterized protein LOC130415192 [Triplophysa dalaica]